MAKSVSSILTFAFLVVTAPAACAECALVSLADAQTLLGPDVTDLSGEDAASQCFFLSNTDSSTFIVQFADRQYFENVTILQPFEAANLGEQGRARVEDHGGASVQFLQGDVSVTMTVRPTMAGEQDYLAALLEVATRTAARLE